MRLYLHAGLHKTGTSSFQFMLRSSASILAKEKVFTPVLNNDANMYQVIYKAQNGQWDPLRHILRILFKNVRRDGYVIFSAEDLENCLFDHQFALEIDKIARSEGFEEIKWVYVIRDQFSYFESLYAQLSKNGLLVRYDKMAESIIKNGVYISEIEAFKWYFVFDYSLLEVFKKEVSRSVYVFNMQQFTSGFSGKILLDSLGVSSSSLASINSVLEHNGKTVRNSRMSARDVERQYIARFFSLSATENNLRRHRHWVDELSVCRINFINGVREHYKRRFKERFKGYKV